MGNKSVYRNMIENTIPSSFIKNKSNIVILGSKSNRNTKRLENNDGTRVIDEQQKLEQ